MAITTTAAATAKAVVTEAAEAGATGVAMPVAKSMTIAV